MEEEAGEGRSGLATPAADEVNPSVATHTAPPESASRPSDAMIRQTPPLALNAPGRETGQLAPTLSARNVIVPREAGEETSRAESASTLTVHPRYRRQHSFSQSSFSLQNGSVCSGSHSRMSSREQFSWDSLAWKEASAEVFLPKDPAKEYLRFGFVSSDNFHSPMDVKEQPRRRHMRSLAAWDRNEVEALGSAPEKNTDVKFENKGRVTPVGRNMQSNEHVFETAPLGHQKTFSLPNHKDVYQAKQEAEEKDTTVDAEKEENEAEVKGSVMTHVLVKFKYLYGVYYLPKSESGTISIGDLVSVESHTGENTGRAMVDLTEYMKDKASMPKRLHHLPKEVLFPEETTIPLERVDPTTKKEVMLRLPRIIRRGLNKGKKRLYYARRRDAEAYSVCQRLIRERGFNLTVAGVEYQADFKRITVLCAGTYFSVVPSELHSFTHQLAVTLRGTVVEVVFSADSPACFEVTRGVTNGAFNTICASVIKFSETEEMRNYAQTPPLSNHQTSNANCCYVDGTMSQISTTSAIHHFGLPPAVPPPNEGMMIAPMNPAAMYGMAGASPPPGWGWSAIPPFTGHPLLAPSMTGRM